MLNKKVKVSNFKFFLVKKSLFNNEIKYIVILKRISYTNYATNCVTTFSREFITNIFFYFYSFILIILFSDVNECDSNPCQNSATCVDEVNKYSCTCQPGYQGSQCETGYVQCVYQ